MQSFKFRRFIGPIRNHLLKKIELLLTNRITQTNWFNLLSQSHVSCESRIYWDYRITN